MNGRIQREKASKRKKKKVYFSKEREDECYNAGEIEMKKRETLR